MHFVGVTSDICQKNQQNIYGCSVANSRIKMFLIVLPTQRALLDHFVGSEDDTPEENVKDLTSPHLEIR
jgi:hypothetical protein